MTLGERVARARYELREVDASGTPDTDRAEARTAILARLGAQAIEWGERGDDVRAAFLAGVAAAKEAASLRHRATELETLTNTIDVQVTLTYAGLVGRGPEGIEEMNADIRRRAAATQEARETIRQLRAAAARLEAGPRPGGGSLTLADVATELGGILGGEQKTGFTVDTADEKNKRLQKARELLTRIERGGPPWFSPCFPFEAGYPEALAELERILGITFERRGPGFIIVWQRGSFTGPTRAVMLDRAAEWFQLYWEWLPEDPRRRDLAFFRARIAALGGKEERSDEAPRPGGHAPEAGVCAPELPYLASDPSDPARPLGRARCHLFQWAVVEPGECRARRGQGA